jgi:hypothetical protein
VIRRRNAPGGDPLRVIGIDLIVIGTNVTIFVGIDSSVIGTTDTRGIGSIAIDTNGTIPTTDTSGLITDILIATVSAIGPRSVADARLTLPQILDHAGGVRIAIVTGIRRLHRGGRRGNDDGQVMRTVVESKRFIVMRVNETVWQ